MSNYINAKTTDNLRRAGIPQVCSEEMFSGRHIALIHYVRSHGVAVATNLLRNAEAREIHPERKLFFRHAKEALIANPNHFYQVELTFKKMGVV